MKLEVQWKWSWSRGTSLNQNAYRDLDCELMALNDDHDLEAIHKS